jgi:TldD protein
MDTTPGNVLTRFGVDEMTVSRALGDLLGRDVDDADIYFEHIDAESISLEESMVKKAGRSVRQGVGVRAVTGERTGYAHSDAVDATGLLEAAAAAKAIARTANKDISVALATTAAQHDLYPVGGDEPPAVNVPLDVKIDLLNAIDERARAHDPRIEQVMASISSNLRTVVIVQADGKIVADVRPLLVLSVRCIAVDGSNRQVGSGAGGGRYSFETLLTDNRWEDWADEAAQRAILNLNAIDCPAGTMDVVLGPGWPGILLHEAVGHGLEGDFNRKKTSAFSGLLGKKVASEGVTVIDDGTIASRRGSLNVDDEGTPTQRTVLIENGILKGFMQDRLNARLMGVPATGNGRRQSYAHTPMPRMTNTFMMAGQEAPEDIIKGVKNGIYAVAFGGGQVDITSGKFVFSGSEAYLIEDGKVTAPVKGATFIGNGPDVLKRVTAVGHDLALDNGIGTCGKDGQSVPVGVGMPTIRIDNLTVGGVSA